MINTYIEKWSNQERTLLLILLSQITIICWLYISTYLNNVFKFVYYPDEVLFIKDFIYSFRFWQDMFKEELYFRFLPLTAIILLTSKRLTIFTVATVASMIFGYLHGGWNNILLQGVSGFLLCFAFVYCGGIKKRFLKAFIVTYCLHVSSNLFFVIST
jgi:membrane protease YdiL (CAAX protease family)